MSKLPISCALAALIAGAALPCAPAGAQQLPNLFLRPPVLMQPAPSYDEPQGYEPRAYAPQNVAPDSEDNDNAQLAPNLQRQVVDYPTREARGTIIVDTPHTYLYLVLGNGKAMRYGIGVGRQGFTWSGVKAIVRKTEWPDWYPPQEMIARQPYLPRMVAGGPGNPLGARAMYIGGTEYRIHGTNDPTTIGKHVSSGCIRLTNDNISDLYSRVTVGSKVIVLPMSGAREAEAAPNKRARTSWNASRPDGIY